jgi:hypothetical protein
MVRKEAGPKSGSSDRDHFGLRNPWTVRRVQLSEAWGPVSVLTDKKDAMKIIASLIAVLVLMAVSVTPALGQTLEGYNNVAGQQQDQVQGGLEQANGPVNGTSPSNNSVAPASNAGAQNSSGSSLPFTGIDIALLLGAGGVLLVAGFGMRRLTRSPSSV